MIGIDTNILLRLFGRDEPPAQVAKAEAVVIEGAREGPILVNPIVLSEFSWTLARQYGLPRNEIAGRIERLLDAGDLEIAFEDEVRSALHFYRAGRADFPDYLIATLNHGMGCRTTATFDRQAGDCALMTLVREA